MRIYGYSDDLIDIEGVEVVGAGSHWAAAARANGDEFGGDAVTLRIGDDKGGLTVSVVYGEDGCWSANLQLMGEDVPIPWPVHIGHEGHTVVVEVDCPDGVPVERVGAAYATRKLAPLDTPRARVKPATKKAATKKPATKKAATEKAATEKAATEKAATKSTRRVPR